MPFGPFELFLCVCVWVGGVGGFAVVEHWSMKPGLVWGNPAGGGAGRQSFFTSIVGCRAMLYGQHKRMPHGTCHMQGSATRTAPTGAMIFLFYQR